MGQLPDSESKPIQSRIDEPPVAPSSAESDQSRSEHENQHPTETNPIPSENPPDGLGVNKNLDQWLWLDPMASDERLKSGSVLLDDMIEEYVRHGLLFDESTFELGKLKGGSYTMTPAEKGAWMFLPGSSPRKSDKKIPLEEGCDHIGKYYIVPRNSLVFIRLKQKLRLPYYIIGRHNLKIRYVYKGLLLGTGPQVDPGFMGNLYIPLHNFTTSDVKIYIESSFVSIDFVRTTTFIGKTSAKSLEELRNELDAKGRKYFDKEKTEREDLEDYLEGSTPRSQMAQFEYDFEAIENKVDKQVEDAKKWASIERLGVVLVVSGLLVTSLNYFRGFVADVKGETDRLRSSVPSTNLSALTSVVYSAELRSTTALTVWSNHVGRDVMAVLAAQEAAHSNIAFLQDRLMKLEVQLKSDRSKTNHSSEKSADLGPN